MRGPLKSFVLERLTDRVLLDSGLVNPGALKRLLDAHLRGLRDFDFLLWRPLAVSMWLAQSQQRHAIPDLPVAIAG
jgi:hypothetical protein